jgi:hypothetical protein
VAAQITPFGGFQEAPLHHVAAHISGSPRRTPHFVQGVGEAGPLRAIALQVVKTPCHAQADSGGQYLLG